MKRILSESFYDIVKIYLKIRDYLVCFKFKNIEHGLNNFDDVIMRIIFLSSYQ